ncbi:MULTISPECIES: hypothetical protein [unclassified Streptomyces]|uniref:hypothetical protein n=1 Tax=unclassified Streptomyces TaxID=2593676 RepID=UPI002259124F|nr:MULTISPECIES: hypothetical protein [unclassified Streptomyces]MCX4992586.1 hypothetical protein [Streptomyces sp. NBC_00568]MCX5002176.1 hypothetical protein [Streptomyces sp. NBC_00638]
MSNPLENGFEQARTVADAVLFEGYVLYPYRASAAKNQLRWQFGVLVPPAWTATTGEHAVQRTECLLEPRAGDRLHAELRFLHVRRRTVERLDADGGYTEVPELDLPDRVLVPWDEGHEERVLIHESLAELMGDQAAVHAVRFDLPDAVEYEPVTDTEGRTLGRLVRRRKRLTGELRPRIEELPGPYRVLRLTVSVHNTTLAPKGTGTDRETALAHSMIGTHLLFGVPGGRFLSLTDPPEWARPAAASCHNDHTWPVLAGPPGTEDVMLSSPIILEDHPAVAEESPGPLYDATEIDEILSLRTAALTEREKREARGTDARAAEVIDLVDDMPEAVRDRLHGAIRGLREITGDSLPGETRPTAPETGPTLPEGPGHPWWDPAQDPGATEVPAVVVINGESVRAGSRVLLRPGARRSDAQDAFLFGRHATVEAVVGDLDGETHLAVVVDDDPGTDVRRAQGRFLYFKPDEVAPLKEEAT